MTENRRHLSQLIGRSGEQTFTICRALSTALCANDSVTGMYLCLGLGLGLALGLDLSLPLSLPLPLPLSLPLPLPFMSEQVRSRLGIIDCLSVCMLHVQTLAPGPGRTTQDLQPRLLWCTWRALAVWMSLCGL